LSPLGQFISNWLQTGPGLIVGDTLEDMWAAAHAASGLQGYSVEDFKKAIDRAGYRPQPRKRSGAQAWALALPEKFKGF
jgi:hypothetical protein